MAQPIPLKLPPRDPKQELLTRLEQAPAEHAAALLDGYELLQQLHEHGVFNLARGALGATGKMVESVSTGANSSESIRAMRNAIILAKMLGAIDPGLLQGVSSAVCETIGDTRRVESRPPGLFSLLWGLNKPNQRRGLAIMSRLLGKIGSTAGDHAQA